VDLPRTGSGGRGMNEFVFLVPGLFVAMGAGALTCFRGVILCTNCCPTWAGFGPRCGPPQAPSAWQGACFRVGRCTSARIAGRRRRTYTWERPK
jgi:hypothetical protein